MIANQKQTIEYFNDINKIND